METLSVANKEIRLGRTFVSAVSTNRAGGHPLPCRVSFENVLDFA